MKIPRIPTTPLKVLLALNVTYLLLLGFAYPFIEPGSGSYIIASLTLIPISLLFVMIAVLLYVNERKSKETAS